MDNEALASRPESPKKKIKSNPAADSEAEPSNSSDNEAHGSSSPIINGLGAPNRKERILNIPDSSCEASTSKSTERFIPRVQEEEVSSSENSVGKIKETEETTICDSASLDSTSDSTEKPYEKRIEL